MRNALYPEVNLIVTPDIKEFTIQALNLAPDYFWVIPASSTGKYHPLDSLGEGGLVRHTKKVVYFARELCRAFEVEDQRQIDSITSACILHDTIKNGLYNSGHTADEHPLLPRRHYHQIAHLTESFDQIMDCIEPHMGRWGVKGGARKPQSQMEWLVHLADYIASRKEVYLDLDDEVQPEGKRVQVREDLRDRVQDYLRLKEEGKKIEEELAAIRESFLQEMDKAGRDNLVTSAGVVRKSVYTKASYDAEKVKEVLSPKGLFEEVTIVTVDEDKVNELIERGKVSKEEVAGSYTEKKIVSIRVTKR